MSELKGEQLNLAARPTLGSYIITECCRHNTNSVEQSVCTVVPHSLSMASGPESIVLLTLRGENS